MQNPVLVTTRGRYARAIFGLTWLLISIACFLYTFRLDRQAKNSGKTQDEVDTKWILGFSSGLLSFCFAAVAACSEDIVIGYPPDHVRVIRINGSSSQAASEADEVIQMPQVTETAAVASIAPAPRRQVRFQLPSPSSEQATRPASPVAAVAPRRVELVTAPPATGRGVRFHIARLSPHSSDEGTRSASPSAVVPGTIELATMAI
jgi:hypothetical protein